VTNAAASLSARRASLSPNADSASIAAPA
jgi:hypothetical protein